MGSYAESVARTTDGVDQLGFMSIIDLAAQTSHENFQYVCEWIVILIPHALGNLRSCYHCSFIFDEYLQQIPLFRSQIDRLSGTLHLARTQIHLQICNDFAFLPDRRLPTGESAH